jgi:hypothetical protein
MGPKDFIVQIDDERNFFTVLRDSLVFGSPFPSYATNMEYEVADAVCRRIREKGYFEAVVCDLRGEPVTAASLESPKAVSEWRIKEVWNDPLSVEDLSPSESTGASAKIDRVIGEMQASTRESSELMEFNRKEFEERKQNSKR